MCMIKGWARLDVVFVSILVLPVRRTIFTMGIAAKAPWGCRCLEAENPSAYGNKQRFHCCRMRDVGVI